MNIYRSQSVWELDMKKALGLLAALLVAVGPWGATLGSLAEILQPGNLFPLAGIVGGVIGAWLAQSPRGVK